MPALVNFNKASWEPEIIRYFSSLSFYFDHARDKKIRLDLQPHTAAIKWNINPRDPEIPTHGLLDLDQIVLRYFYCLDKKWNRPVVWRNEWFVGMCRLGFSLNNDCSLKMLRMCPGNVCGSIQTRENVKCKLGRLPRTMTMMALGYYCLCMEYCLEKTIMQEHNRLSK